MTRKAPIGVLESSIRIIVSSRLQFLRAGFPRFFCNHGEQPGIEQLRSLAFNKKRNVRSLRKKGIAAGKRDTLSRKKIHGKIRHILPHLAPVARNEFPKRTSHRESLSRRQKITLQTIG